MTGGPTFLHGGNSLVGFQSLRSRASQIDGNAIFTGALPTNNLFKEFLFANVDETHDYSFIWNNLLEYPFLFALCIRRVLSR